jgi:hypothetical protein
MELEVWRMRRLGIGLSAAAAAAIGFLAALGLSRRPAVAAQFEFLAPLLRAAIGFAVALFNQVLELGGHRQVLAHATSPQQNSGGLLIGDDFHSLRIPIADVRHR